MIGFVLCSTEGPEVDLKNPINPLDPDNLGVAKGPPRFYNSEVSFVSNFFSPFPVEQKTVSTFPFPV